MSGLDICVRLLDDEQQQVSALPQPLLLNNNPRSNALLMPKIQDTETDGKSQYYGQLLPYIVCNWFLPCFGNIIIMSRSVYIVTYQDRLHMSSEETSSLPTAAKAASLIASICTPAAMTYVNEETVLVVGGVMYIVGCALAAAAFSLESFAPFLIGIALIQSMPLAVYVFLTVVHQAAYSLGQLTHCGAGSLLTVLQAAYSQVGLAMKTVLAQTIPREQFAPLFCYGRALDAAGYIIGAFAFAPLMDVPRGVECVLWAFAGVALVMSISHVLVVKKFLSLHTTHTEQHGTEQDQEKMREKGARRMIERQKGFGSCFASYIATTFSPSGLAQFPASYWCLCMGMTLFIGGHAFTEFIPFAFNRVHDVPKVTAVYMSGLVAIASAVCSALVGSVIQTHQKHHPAMIMGSGLIMVAAHVPAALEWSEWIGWYECALHGVSLAILGAVSGGTIPGTLKHQPHLIGAGYGWLTVFGAIFYLLLIQILYKSYAHSEKEGNLDITPGEFIMVGLGVAITLVGWGYGYTHRAYLKPDTDSTT